MSLPPVVNWQYNYQAELGSDKALLTDHFLKPPDWLNKSK
ncbi:MAG: coproporphyrinogen III oxidase [Gammaproteobacteria bacterium]|jgi:coproporphyrinogen III oxidase